jgi:hypothetical protein
MSLHSAVDDAEADAFLGWRPGAKRNASATPENTERLSQEGIRIWEMRDAEVADNGIEAGTREWECTSITLTELD